MQETNADAWKNLSEEKPDPWGLSPQQAAALDAYLIGGCNKRASERLGVCKNTLSAHLNRARKKMSCPTVVLALVQWDRYRRGDRDSTWGIVV